MTTELNEYWRAFHDERREAIDRIVARHPRASTAEIVTAIIAELPTTMRPLIAVELNVGADPAAADDEPTSSGRPSPPRTATSTRATFSENTGALTPCERCSAVGHGNITCSTCVSHWTWVRDVDLAALLVAIGDREPESPCGPEDVARFVAKLGGRS